MAKLNLLVHVNAYEDVKDTNDPSQNNVKWNRDLQGLSIAEPESRSINLPAGQSHTLFEGTVSTSADVTTTWDIALVSGSTYRISHNAGTTPVFRTQRAIGHDATTEVTVTKNAKLMTFTATGGTLWDLVSAGTQVGDEIRVGNVFNTANRGKFKVISFSATQVTVENELGQAEGPITLGATFIDQINVFSAGGIQVGDKVDIVDGFSPVTQGTYEITDVNPDYIEIFSGYCIPTETGVSNNPDALIIYRNAKQFLYLESNKKLEIEINGSSTTNTLEPLKVGTQSKPGIFMSSASIKRAAITNTSQETAKILYITAE